jgi:alcohol dehydrogenase (cytochrome c)
MDTRLAAFFIRAFAIGILGCCMGGGGAAAQEANNGASSFAVRCAVCHGGDGGGTERAPSLKSFVAGHADTEIAALVRHGVRAMPAHDIGDPEMMPLLAFLHSLAPATAAEPPKPHRAITLEGGTMLEGEVVDETNFTLALAGGDGRVHLLTRDGAVYREPSLAPQVDWPRYDGSLTANRHSPMQQINTGNVSHLAMAWMFPATGAPRLETTPVVVDGVMYATAVNTVYALDAASGRLLWRFKRAQTPGLLGEAAGGANRGVGVASDRVLFMTDNAHLLALAKRDGKLLWEIEMTDWPNSQYSASGAPLVVGDHVISGVAGGEEGARGFVASYEVATGRREWQFWTIPKPGEKLSETWVGSALEHGCGATWMSGSYDPDLNTLYWAVGNPCPDFNGAQRKGDNLYTDSVLALDPASGKLKWYFQFTPHDTHDYDADEPLMLVDEVFAGKPRKLLVQASRNGFFFVLDRVDGKMLLATPFVGHITWASGFTKEGKAIRLPDSDPTPAGNLACPAAATNWMSAAYDPELKLMYFSAADRCAITKLMPSPFEMGQRYFNGTGTMVDGGTRSVRALDIQTGKTAWDYVQVGGTRGSSGTLSTGGGSTGGGLVFFGEDSGMFTALDGKTGKPVWHFSSNDAFRASPMTYMVGGRQFVAIASASGILSFALVP